MGFINASEIAMGRDYFKAAERLWAHIKTQYRDGSNEWTWYARSAQRPMYKAGAWKCPYHNGRAMLELEKRQIDDNPRMAGQI